MKDSVQTNAHRADSRAMKLRVLAVIAALLIPVLPASAASEEPWEFEGGGWGHGVGMSQFGVLGQVQQTDRTVEQILQHYYRDTSIGEVPGGHWLNNPQGLWVGLVPDNSPDDGAVHLGAIGGGEVTICHPTPDCENANEVITTGATWHFDVREHPNNPGQYECRVRKGSGEGSESWDWGPCRANVTQPDTTGTRIEFNGSQYAHGTLRMTPSANGFHTALALPLEKYLYGLAEVPSSWPAKALRVQAIAGRSYAVATAKARGGADGTSKLSTCGCHLWATTVDQAFVGWAKEDPANDGDRWTNAVDATAGDVVTYNGETISAFYSSSNGGASENVEDAWPGSTPRPYLTSVEDSWSADPNVNPLATWSVKASDQAMANYFGWDRVLDAEVQQGPPGVLVQFAGYDNGQPVNTTLNGSDLASLVRSIGFGYNAPGSNSPAIRVSPYFTAVTDPPGFDDIIGNTFENDIEWLLNEEVTKGCNPPDNTLFCPLDDVSRGEMAAFLTRYFDLPAASGDHFSDDTGSTFENDINRLAEAGITRGCNPPANDEFCPDDRVSREQMAAFLVRAFELTANTHQGFTDVSSSNTFFNDIGKLATAGVTRGCNPPDNTRYCPADNVTRGEMAAFLHRADDLK